MRKRKCRGATQTAIHWTRSPRTRKEVRKSSQELRASTLSIATCSPSTIREKQNREPRIVRELKMRRSTLCPGATTRDPCCWSTR